MVPNYSFPERPGCHSAHPLPQWRGQPGNVQFTEQRSYTVDLCVLYSLTIRLAVQVGLGLAQLALCLSGNEGVAEALAAVGLKQQVLLSTFIARPDLVKDSLVWEGRRGLVLLCGGETTVTVRGTGRGGRNQEMALAFHVALEGHATTLAERGVQVRGRCLSIVRRSTGGVSECRDGRSGRSHRCSRFMPEWM